jgi:hypothetical protein
MSILRNAHSHSFDLLEQEIGEKAGVPLSLLKALHSLNSVMYLRKTNFLINHEIQKGLSYVCFISY